MKVTVLGVRAEFQKLEGLPFPVMAELEIELTTKGPECLSFKALSQPKQAGA